MAGTIKQIRFIGTSREDLCDKSVFPDDVRVKAGKELWEVQCGKDPAHWKPFKEVGSGAKEIIIDMAGGWFRVMYVAKFDEAVYVLHAFRKKTNQTSKQDKEITKKRYQEVVEQRSKK